MNSPERDSHSLVFFLCSLPAPFPSLFGDTACWPYECTNGPPFPEVPGWGHSRGGDGRKLGLEERGARSLTPPHPLCQPSVLAMAEFLRLCPHPCHPEISLLPPQLCRPKDPNRPLQCSPLSAPCPQFSYPITSEIVSSVKAWTELPVSCQEPDGEPSCDPLTVNLCAVATHVQGSCARCHGH